MLQKKWPMTVLILSVLSVSCAPAENSGALEQIVGGGVIQGSHFPSLVKLEFSYGNCSGTKINRNQILTAGHCIFDDDKLRHMLNPGDGFGMVNHISKLGEFTVADIWVHPNYKKEGTIWKDLAVVTTHEEIPQVPRAELGREKPSANANVTMTGYGCSKKTAPDSDSRTGSPVREPGAPPRYGHLQLLEYAAAKKVFESHQVFARLFGRVPIKIPFDIAMWSLKIPDSALRDRRVFFAAGAAAGALSDACVGDSGGGLYMKGKNTVIGVTSWYIEILDSRRLNALQAFASVPDAIEAIDNVIKTAKAPTKNSPK